MMDDEFLKIIDRVPFDKRGEFAAKALKALADLAQQYPEPTTTKSARRSKQRRAHAKPTR